MATARAIQTSVVHITLGTLIGTAIEAILPAYSASSSVAEQTFEALVQAGLIGVSLVAVGPALTADDPTYGIPFSTALFAAQPEFAKRLAGASGLAKRQVLRAAQRMAAPFPEAESSTQ